MSTLVRIITSSILALLMTSCNYDFNIGPGIEGNGNVLLKERQLNGSFNAIKVSRGIEVYVTLEANSSLKVKADENLHPIITTEVHNGTLKISSDERIKSAKAKKVILSVPNITDIDTSSGAYIFFENVLKTEDLSLDSSSGSHMVITLETSRLRCEASSGSSIKLKGKTNSLKANTSSGSYIRASELEAQFSRVSASSGANIVVNTTKELTANASSGGNISYSGNPEKVNKSDGVSGSIRRN